MSKISNEVIENFLQGSDPQEYIVAIEAGYSEPTVTLVINDPVTGKRLEPHPFKPFLWFKHDITSILYGGNRVKRIEAGRSYGVKISELRTSNSEGFSPERLERGYKYMATCNKSYNDLINFFKNGGVDVFHKDFSKNFVMFRADEQFLIQSGKRLFKGMDDYDDVHRFQFDLETTGLFASKDSIFQIGVRDNRKMEHVLEVKGETLQEKRNEERATITKFFKIIDFIQPDIITGYNSENFDWPFLFERAERLSIPITDLAVTLNRISKIKRKPATVKFGGETEHYLQTNMYGYNIMDISHAVRRAMAINSEIKSWGLKYITQYSDIAKPNRVYVPGDKINTTWKDKDNKYAFNDSNGDWYMITDKTPLKEYYVIKKGDYIVQRYLCDDLWETEQIDNIFNQASFLIAKMLPTSFQRSSTMGTAGQWKLIMAAWSYENGLAIPETQTKRDFTGGLSRLLELGYARDVYKLDYAALYPKTQITHKIFPDLDISGVMEGILTYVVDTRDKFKFLTGTEKKTAKKYDALLKEGKDLTSEQKEEYKKLVHDHKALSNLYDKKQLPLKILANSWFGSYGAPYIFNWGDTDSAEETTCRGRQYLRLMVKHFTETHGFRALVGDTDGFNFAAPANINEIKYVAKGSHWKTIDDAGKELIGIDAALAEFNEIYMEGRMGLDLDDVCSSTINFARKNYANDIGGKIKLVGNSVKSKKMSVYIEEFLGKGIRMLLDGDGHSFINYYYEYVDKIYNYQIPLVKIASKAKIKSNIADYKKKATMKNKAGNPMPKQAHMELAMQAGLDVTLGDTLFYINTGTSKSHGDLKTVHLNKMTKKQTEKWVIDNPDSPIPTVKREVQLNCKLIDPKVIEHDFEMIKELEMLKKAITAMESEDNINMDAFTSTGERIEQINSELYTDEYNVARYLDAFNKKIKPLLVCFNLDVRNSVILDIVKVKDKTTKKITEKLKDRTVFTIAECELVSGISNKPGDQDSYEDLMRMEDKEIKFWIKVNKLPNNMTQEEWDVLQIDYVERMRIAKIEGIKHEKEVLDDIFKHLELQDLRDIVTKSTLPIDVFVIADVDVDNDGGVYLLSRKWGEMLCSYDDIFKYKLEAIERDKYYQLTNINNIDNRYELYLEYLTELNFMSGETITNTYEEIELLENTDISIDKLKEAAEKVIVVSDEPKKKKIVSEDSEDDELEFKKDGDGNLTRTDETIILDDEFDDTFGDMPEDYIVDEYNSLVEEEEEEEPDEWGF
jgi:DNA polymerase elongation subunit (family B)